MAQHDMDSAELRAAATATAEKVYVSGSWEWQPELECYETAYAVESLGEPWNGFATPRVTREVMDAIVGRQAMINRDDNGDDQGAVLSWDRIRGQVRVEEDESTTYLSPDSDGLFHLGSLGWCWEQVGEDDRVIRRIG